MCSWGALIYKTIMDININKKSKIKIINKKHALYKKLNLLIIYDISVLANHMCFDF